MVRYSLFNTITVGTRAEFLACYDLKSFSDLLLQTEVRHSEGISYICPSYI